MALRLEGEDNRGQDCTLIRTTGHSSNGGSVGISTIPAARSGSSTWSGIWTSPRLTLKGTHQSDRKSMVWTVIPSGSVRKSVAFSYPVRVSKLWEEGGRGEGEVSEEGEREGGKISCRM